MHPYLPETFLWLEHARQAQDQQRADQARQAAAATRDRRELTRPRPVPTADATAGVVVDVAEASPAMAGELRQFLRGLSPTTTYRRFLTPAMSPSSGELHRLLRADDDSRALVARHDGEIVGHAMAARQPGAHSTDLGIVVADRWQHQGIGRRLLGELLASCPAAGAPELELTVAASNDPVGRLIRRYWPDAVASFDAAVIHYRVPVSQPVPAGRAIPVPSQGPRHPVTQHPVTQHPVTQHPERQLCGAATER